MTFLDWAGARGYKVRRGTGEPLRPAHGYGPDEGEEYVRLKRGYAWDATGKDEIPLLGIVLFGHKLAHYEGIRNTFASRSDEDLHLQIPVDWWTDEMERLLAPAKRRTISAALSLINANRSPEHLEALRDRMAAARAAKRSGDKESEQGSATVAGAPA